MQRVMLGAGYCGNIDYLSFGGCPWGPGEPRRTRVSPEMTATRADQSYERGVQECIQTFDDLGRCWRRWKEETERLTAFMDMVNGRERWLYALATLKGGF